MTPDAGAAFDELYRASSDPWGTHTRWYERRKRDLLLASLPLERYGACYEAGCGTGHLSAELAPRCDVLVCTDASEEATTLARRTLAVHQNVRVEQRRLPDDWPERAFDLIVVGELLYFLTADERVALADAARRSAGSTGLVVACDWRHDIESHGGTGEMAHRHFGRSLGLPPTYEYMDDDFILTGWCATARSVAAREGLR